MNVFIGIGRLCKDPEIRHTQDGTTIANYTLAIDRAGKKDEADFLRCVCFGKVAEFAEKYLTKGIKIAVEGRVQTGSYTNRDGQKIYTTDIVVSSHEFCESKKTGEAQGAPEGTDSFMDVPTDIDDDIPFR